jgi:hypothetical protein
MVPAGTSIGAGPVGGSPAPAADTSIGPRLIEKNSSPWLNMAEQDRVGLA